jgi:hypothetical protein
MTLCLCMQVMGPPSDAHRAAALPDAAEAMAWFLRSAECASADSDAFIQQQQKRGKLIPVVLAELAYLPSPHLCVPDPASGASIRICVCLLLAGFGAAVLPSRRAAWVHACMAQPSPPAWELS